MVPEMKRVDCLAREQLSILMRYGGKAAKGLGSRNYSMQSRCLIPLCKARDYLRLTDGFHWGTAEHRFQGLEN